MILFLNSRDLQSVGVTSTGLETLDGDVSVVVLQDTEFLSLLNTEVDTGFNIFSPVRDRFLFENEWEDTSVQVRESGGSWASGDQDDWTVWSVLGDQSWGVTGSGQNNDSLGLLFENSGDSGGSDGFGGGGWLWSTVSHVIVVWQVSNSLFGNDGRFQPWW